LGNIYQILMLLLRVAKPKKPYKNWDGIYFVLTPFSICISLANYLISVRKFMLLPGMSPLEIGTSVVPQKQSKNLIKKY
jgi:hypothetical protein